MRKQPSQQKKSQQQQPKQIYLQRIKCDCVAQKHELINNCLSCGKVVCAQQGQGPCLQCGKTVHRPDTTFIVSSTDKTLFPSLSPEQLNKVSQQRSNAILHKNKLVERDRSTNITQNIIDEQMDYYDVSENQWLDENDRQKAIDRILEKDRFVEQESRKVNVVYNEVTGEFQRREFEFDEEAFRKEGQKFVQEKERDEFNKRMQQQKSSKGKWKGVDERVLKNERMKEICGEILRAGKRSGQGNNTAEKQAQKRRKEVEKKANEKEILLDEDEKLEIFGTVEEEEQETQQSQES